MAERKSGIKKPRSSLESRASRPCHVKACRAAVPDPPTRAWYGREYACPCYPSINFVLHIRPFVLIIARRAQRWRDGKSFGCGSTLYLVIEHRSISEKNFWGSVSGQ